MIGKEGDRPPPREHMPEWLVVEVSAIFTLLRPEESGWSTPVGSGLRPNHNFIGPGNRDMCMGQITVPGDEKIFPGESKAVMIQFVLLPAYAALLRPGFMWRIQAGGQHFANGEVIEVLCPD